MVSSGGWLEPEPYTDYNIPPSMGTIYRNVLVESGMPLDNFDFAAALVFGGVLAYASNAPVTQDNLEILRKSEMLIFGSLVASRLQREIAQLAISSGVDDIKTLRQILLRSYDGTVGELTRNPNDVALAIEISVGVADPASTPGFNVNASLVFDREAAVPAYITADPDFTPGDPRCGGRYMVHANRSYDRLLWDRCLRVTTGLPWLIPGMLEATK
jgi:hypothetical protein